MLLCMPLDTPLALRRDYSLLEEACARLNAREDREHFAPDVYGQLMRGEARAFVVREDEQAVGLFTVSAGSNAAGYPALHVVLAYTRPGTSEQVLLLGLQECERLAREERLSTLVMGSQRRGWIRRGPQLGFVLSEFKFEKQVSA